MKVGIIGTGPIARLAVLNIRQVAGCDVMAAWCHSVRGGQEFCRDLGVEKYYTSLDEFLASDAFSFVYVATPNTLHYAHAKASLLAGKDVLVEKPFAASAAQAADLIATAQAQHRFLFDGTAAIWYENFSELCRRVSELGSVRGVYMNMSQRSRRYDQYLEGTVTNVFNPTFYGGALYDLNTIDALTTCYLFGKPTSVSYQPVQGFNGVDVSGTLVLGYPGFEATLVAAKDANVDGVVSIQGEQGDVLMECNPGVYQNVVLTTKGGDGSLHTERIDVEDVADQRVNMFVKVFGMVERGEFEQAMDRLVHTQQASEVLEEAWRNAGLPFEEV